MPHFHLHMRHGPDRVEDMEGAEYNNLMSARTDALVAAREIMSRRVAQGKHAVDGRFEIADEDGDIWLVVPFFEAMSH